ncbi:MAG TPA: hypothetical protein VLB02_02535, partial [Candidatus Paceibacterota bacterium]|nr:hypothetical protein [Candidatus Paceibacterota bacterium]
MMSAVRAFFSRYRRVLLPLLFLFLYSVGVSYAVPPTSKYQPGSTLDPACAPGSTNCSVEILPDQTGNVNKVLVTDGTTASWNSTITAVTLATPTIAGAASDPTGADGLLYYNTATDTFKGYDGSWQDLATQNYVTTNHYTKTELSTADGSQVSWFNITNAPIIGTNTDTRLIDGGQVSFVSGYTFLVSAANYQILGTSYSSPQSQVTLSASDPTNPRIDVVAVNTSGAVVVIEGTPGVSPEQPYVDPETQLMLTFVNVAAASSDPGITTVDIYKENTGPAAEWSRSSNSGTISLNSSASPRNGTKNIEGTSVTSGAKLTFSPAAGFDINGTTQLVLYVKSKATWGNNRKLSIAFQNASGQKGNAVLISKSGSFGFDSSQTSSYQQIAIPISNFGVPSGTLITSMTITAIGSQGTFGFYIDDLTLESGSPIVGGAATTVATSNSSTITFTGNGLVSNPLSASVNTTGLDATYFKQNGNSFAGLATVGTNDANALAFETSGSERIRILSTGNVSIGDTSPDQLFEVLSSGAALTQLSIG